MSIKVRDILLARTEHKIVGIPQEVVNCSSSGPM